MTILEYRIKFFIHRKNWKAMWHFNMMRYLLKIIVAIIFISACSFKKEKSLTRPNFLLLMSDNQSWNHLGCYGDEVVKSPVIDKLATKGVRFTHALCAAPSCTPARASMLTGQEIWRLEEGANLWGILPSKFQVYTELLMQSGYHVGMEGKGWGPGNYEDGGWDRNPGGEKYESFEAFYEELEKDQPFCYWFSSRDPHRPYKTVGQEKDSLVLKSVQVPPYLPDNDAVRSDILDYYTEVENFDKDVDSFMKLLSDFGQEENTVVVICSDNGWQMPRGLANLYDFGTRIPLIILMPDNNSKNRVVDDFVSLNDLAPTFLELAGLPIPKDMTAQSLVNILSSDQEGIIESERDFIVSARERHAFVRQGGAGYGGRSIRTRDFLYIRNYDYERWPAGDPPLFGDVDAHMLHYPSPTKLFVLQHKEEESNEYFRLAFDKRPYEELYELKTDPFQMHNLASKKKYEKTKELLSSQLDDYLKETKDPRIVGGDLKWIGAEYYAPRDFHPVPNKEAREALGLKKKYSYVD